MIESPPFKIPVPTLGLDVQIRRRVYPSVPLTDRAQFKLMIKFGTSGWRAIIADEFTFDAVRRVTQKISNWITQRAPGSQVIVAGHRVTSVNRIDGAMFILEDGSWILMRPSGTKPLVRVYAEASNDRELEVLLESGRKYILG
jgi:phosphomannomutase